MTSSHHQRPTLIATVGPASFKCVDGLVQAGADILRLNTSHILGTALTKTIADIRRAAPHTPLVIDLQGTKLRLGKVTKRAIHQGDEVIFSKSPHLLPTSVHLPHDIFFDSVHDGDIFSVGDGELKFRVSEHGPLSLTARALTEGMLLPRKGVTLINRPLTESGVTPADLSRIAEVLKTSARNVSWALSFISSAEDAAQIRSHLPQSARFIAKIERQSAVEHIHEIAHKTDEIWICRGDLGEQLGMSGMAEFVSGFEPKEFGVPCILAGQVLHHLTEHPLPTRAEVCQLVDALKRGFGGIVLSDETSSGTNPVNAVSTARTLLDDFGEAVRNQ